MNRLATVSLFALFVCPHELVSQPAAIPAKDRMVVIISLDGFPAYDLDDPKLPIPTLRKLIEEGSWVKRMHPVNPTVTWPNHTTMVTGLFPRDHGLLFNGALVRTENPFSVRIDPSVAKTSMVHCATLYDIAHEKGLTTAQVDWVAINGAPTITWAFPERAKATDPLVAEMISKGVIKADDVGNAGSPTILWRDQIWTKAGEYVIGEHKPNLLLFHLLSLDATHHNYGPKTLASYDAIAFLDSCVRRLVDAVNKAGMTDRTTVVVVSDHGFKAVKKQIRLKPLLASVGFTEGVQAVPEGGSAMVYLDKDKQDELLPKIQQMFEQTEGVAQVVSGSQIAGLGLPLPTQDAQAPNLIAFAKSDYAFAGGKDGDPVIATMEQTSGSHGYLNTDPDMDAIFMAAGYGVKPHKVLDQVRNLSVAPTLARLLDLKLPKQEAAPLTEIFQ